MNKKIRKLDKKQNLQTIPISLRCYVESERKEQYSKNNYKRINSSSSTVLVFDTETTGDEYQNLLFGSCGVWINDILTEFYLFYADDLKKSDMDTITKFAKKNDYSVLSRLEFVEKIFYPYVYKARAKCVAFNMPFDISRLAINFGKARGGVNKKFRGGFSFSLTENRFLPSIRIKNINSKASFVEFAKPGAKNKNKTKKPTYKGYFLDLKTLTFSLTNKSYSLKNALKDFECSPKIDADEHGIISDEYLNYNVNDTMVTHELYQKTTERYKNYLLSKDANYLYSPASIGKAYLDKIGIKKFDEKNPDFPKEIIGHVMMTYYGGRTEVRMRKNPVRASYVDYTSMYPSVFSLLGMWEFLISDKIVHKHTLKETQAFLDKVTLSHIQDKETWKNMTTICKIIPNNDVLPVRSTYNPDSPATNIGINYVKSEDDTSLWYTLPDLIASKQLSGKTPKIIDAITFYPQGVQSGLRSIEILKGMQLESQENFIKKLIEERIRIKSEIKNKKDNPHYKDSSDAKQDDIKQNILKIIANATSYGIFIQINSTPERKPKEVTVYGLDKFDTNAERTEEPAEYFNPIMSVFLTACSRLILSTAETLVKQNKGQVFYFDTDSIFLTPEHVQLVQDFFQPLNPYDVDVKMFKIEEDDDHNLLHDKLFYGISSKRYVLYDRDDTTKKITIYKYSAHGLGHLLDPFTNNKKGKEKKENWNKQIWEDILSIHYNPDSESDVLEKYHDKYAISQMSASTVDILSRFDKFNEGKSYKNKIKPFNFATVGTGWKKDTDTGETVIPFLPYADEKKRQDVPYMKFVDYKTGKEYPNKDFINTEEFWKSLSEMIDDYTDHKESKSDGDIGELKRKHLLINKFSIRYIGKESNELEESDIVGVTEGNYTKYLNLREIVLGLDVYKEHKKIGVSKSNLFELQKKAKKGEKLKPQKETLCKILNYVKK